MGRQNKKRNHRDFSDPPRMEEQSYGVGDALREVKKRKMSSEPLEDADQSSMATPETAQNVENGTVKDEGWQTVTHKSKKRDADGKKTKYPELVFHCKKQEPIRIADLQQLILYTFADGVAPTWVALKNFSHTRKVVVLMVPGLEKQMFDGTSSLFSDEDTKQEDFDCSTGPSDQVTDVERKRNQFNAWKHGVRPERFNNASPTDISSTTLPTCLKGMADIFSQVWPVKALGDSKYAKVHSPLQAMLIAPLSQRPQDKKDNSHSNQGPDAVRTPISDFIHSADELREAEYPIHPAAFSSIEDGELENHRRVASKQSVDCGWVDSSITSWKPIEKPDGGGPSSHQGHNVYALDCEMVLTTDDVYSLARISVVDWSGATILDKYVKPTLPIKNYFTQYSGITPTHLENITTTLPDIQANLTELCTPSTILLGHSLESDLAALKFTHPFIIDTSLIYPHPRGPPLRSALKYLANKYLHREIQSGGANGHNSVEDALAVLDLVKLKCERGSKFGTFEASGEPIFRALARPRGGKPPKTTAIVDYGTPERGFGKEATHAIGCVDDDAVMEGVIRAVKGDPVSEEIRAGGVDFVWARLRELESYRGWCNNNREYGTVDGLHANGDAASAPAGPNAETNSVSEPVANENDTISPSAPAPTLQTTLAATTFRIARIASSLPACTLLIIYSGTGDPRELGRLQRMQAQYRREFKVKKWDDLSVKWTDDEEQALRRAAERARSGVGFLAVL